MQRIQIVFENLIFFLGQFRNSCTLWSIDYVFSFFRFASMHFFYFNNKCERNKLKLLLFFKIIVVIDNELNIWIIVFFSFFNIILVKVYF